VKNAPVNESSKRRQKKKFGKPHFTKPSEVKNRYGWGLTQPTRAAISVRVSAKAHWGPLPNETKRIFNWTFHGLSIHNRRTKRLSRTLTQKRHGRRSEALILKALGRVGLRPIGVQVQHGGSLWYEAWRIVLLHDWGADWRLKVHFQSAWLAISHSNYLEIGGRKRHLALSVRSWPRRKRFDSLQNPPIRC